VKIQKDVIHDAGVSSEKLLPTSVNWGGISDLITENRFFAMPNWKPSFNHEKGGRGLAANSFKELEKLGKREGQACENHHSIGGKKGQKRRRKEKAVKSPS